MGVTTISFEMDTEQMRKIFGMQDAYIKKLEQDFQVTIVDRNGSVVITGEEENASKASRVLKQLTALSDHGNEIEEQSVDYAIEMGKEDQEDKLMEMDADCICHTISGKPIKPKTLGQKAYVDAIRKNSDLQIICLVGKDDSTGQNFTKALERMDRHFTPEHSAGRFYKGSLTDKQMLESEENIVILGDVNPGCTVISSQSIVVLGGLYGEAYAGLEGEGSYYIAALEMAPEKLKIGDFKYTAQKARWGIKPKVHPQVAYVKNNKVVLESLTKELLGTIS